MNLNDEVICGHLVTAQKKRTNAVYLDLLQEFGRLCQQAGLTYWVAFGSLLGAVRHRGFIPWDDDVDILMPRKDFDKLLRISNEEFGAKEPYFLQTPHTDPSFQQRILRFRRSDTSYITQYDLNMIKKLPDGKPYNMGLALAIFPLDNYPKSRLLQSFQLRIARMGVSFRTDSNYGKKKPLTNALLKVANIFMTEKNIVRFIHWMYRLCPKNRSGLVQSFEGFYDECEIWPAEAFSGTVWLPFEDIMIPAPSGYEQILTIIYGDYMQFPPLEQRVDKHADFMSADIPYTEALPKFLRGELTLPGSPVSH